MARLWCAGFPEKYRHIFGSVAEAFLETWLLHNPCILQDAVVARVEGAPAGFIQLESRQPGLRENAAALWPALDLHFGPVRAMGCLLRLWAAERGMPAPGNVLPIRMLAVDPHYRGRGIASMLLRHAEAHALKLKREQLWVRLSASNKDGIRLYERHGFARQILSHSRRLRWATGEGNYCQMTKQVK